MTVPTKLYRHFADDGSLLYVGISLDAIRRLSQHRDHSGWFNAITRVQIEEFPTREAAIAAELEAINKENPRHNVRGKKPKTPAPPSHADTSRNELLRHIVRFRPIYKLEQAAEALNMRTAAIKRLIREGGLGYIEIPPGQPQHKPKIGITGWQLIDFIEHLEQEKLAKPQLMERVQLPGKECNGMQQQKQPNLLSKKQFMQI